MFQECMESNGKDNSGGCYCGSDNGSNNNNSSSTSNDKKRK